MSAGQTVARFLNLTGYRDPSRESVERFAAATDDSGKFMALKTEQWRQRSSCSYCEAPVHDDSAALFTRLPTHCRNCGAPWTRTELDERGHA